MQIPILKEGEVVCNRCDGKCYESKLTKQKETPFCKKCHGHGKVDWITQLTWKESKDEIGIDLLGDLGC